MKNMKNMKNYILFGFLFWASLVLAQDYSYPPSSIGGAITADSLTLNNNLTLSGGPLNKFLSTDGTGTVVGSAASSILLASLTDPTGSGAAVFGTSPTISGATMSGGTINNMIIGGSTAAAATFTSISLTPTAQTTQSILNIPNADSLTTGSIASLVSNSGNNSIRNLFYVHNSNSTADNTVPVYIEQSGGDTVLYVDRNATLSTDPAVEIFDAGTGTGESLSIRKTGSVYANGVGIVQIERDQNFTGVASTTAVDLNIIPGAAITEPSSGTFSYSAAKVDLGGLPVTAGAGTSIISALHLVGSPDADIGTSYSLLTTSGIVGLGSKIRFLTGGNLTSTEYECGRNADATNSYECNIPSSALFKFNINGGQELSISSTSADFQNNNITTTGSLIGNSLVINGGPSITAHYSGARTNLTSASISPTACGDYGTITVTGASPGDSVYASPDAVSSATGIEDSNLSWSAYVSSSNTVTIRACNPTAVAIDAGDDQEWRADVWKH